MLWVPASGVLLLVAGILAICLVFSALWIFGFERRRFMTGALRLGVVIVAGLMVVFPQSDLFLTGLREYYQARITPDQLQAIAAQARTMEPPEQMAWAGGLALRFSTQEASDSEDATYRAELQKLDGFSNLGRQFTLTCRRKLVCITRGSALAGHWGIVILPPGDPGPWEAQQLGAVLPWTSDLAVFRSGE